MKRHGYYCRSRRTGGTTRVRSCVSCARVKTRCDNRRPECSRCITRAIPCHYPANAPRSTGATIRHSDDAPTEPKIASPLEADSPSVEHHQEAIINGDTTPDIALVTSEPEFGNLGKEYLVWNDADVDFTGLLDPLTKDQTVQYPLLRSSSLLRHSDPSSDPTFQVQQSIPFPNISIPPIPIDNVRSLIRRPRVETGAQRIASLILNVLKSYPLMMLRHNTLPPFVHPHLISSNVEETAMEPLTDCISLVHMISSEVKGSRKLFWKNVRLECERLCQEVSYPRDDSRRRLTSSSLALEAEQMGSPCCYAGPHDLHSHKVG